MHENVGPGRYYSRKISDLDRSEDIGLGEMVNLAAILKTKMAAISNFTKKINIQFLTQHT